MSATLDSLTPQQRSIAVLIAQGLGNKQIARRMGLADNTVKNHITIIYQRLGMGVSDCPRVQVALWYWRQVGLPVQEGQ